uniref:Ras association domain family member 11 n=1 Tax=Sander lucioperca TaxID=283035 RepID=A0A8D0ASE4_SANLU
MEVKVSVDGIPRVVCGVTEKTTCQEVVIALAQALGQTGRYTLQEKFKDFERCMAPNECLLETLKKYGEQAREVRLTLLHNGPSVWDEMSTRMRRGSNSLSLHRQSLPPLPCLRQEAEQQKEDLKRPKRKSLTLMEEAWEWLESLGKGKVYSTACDNENSKRTDKRNRTSLETIIYQLSCLQDFQVQTACIDKQILELEEKQRAKKAEQEAQQRMVEEEMEQIKFWENELKAEEGYEKDLQCQFLEMRANAVECKTKLEEYKRKMQGLDFFATQNVVQEDLERLSKGANSATEISAVSTKDLNQQQSDSDGDVNINRKFLPREDLNPPHALNPPNQIKERRPTGPTELREWWARWAQAQIPQSQTKKKVIHRSELTIHLGSTKV